MDAATLDACTGCGLMVAESWADPLSIAMARASIVTPLRQAAFLAQVGYESAGFSVLEENLDYSAEGLLACFPNEFNAATAAEYARQPERIANRAYAFKNGNGNEASGDGWLFRGRALIQLTGRQNYRDFTNWLLSADFVKQPDSILDSGNAAMCAAWYWLGRGLNTLADTQDFPAITRSIQGPGMLGEEKRESLYQHARAALAIAPWKPTA